MQMKTCMPFEAHVWPQAISQRSRSPQFRHVRLEEGHHCTTPLPVHWRELTAFAGERDPRSLPIERATAELQELIWSKPLSGVRSPPGSGRTTFLPELLQWWVQAGSSRGTVVIVLPTLYACHKIKESLVYFRGWPEDRIRRVTGVDGEDIFVRGHTHFTITTY